MVFSDSNPIDSGSRAERAAETIGACMCVCVWCAGIDEILVRRMVYVPNPTT